MFGIKKLEISKMNIILQKYVGKIMNYYNAYSFLNRFKNFGKLTDFNRFKIFDGITIQHDLGQTYLLKSNCYYCHESLDSVGYYMLSRKDKPIFGLQDVTHDKMSCRRNIIR